MNTYYPPSRNPVHDAPRPARFASSEGFPDTIVPVKRAPLGNVRVHSVGGLYPLYVMAIANRDHLHYEVHNLQDGTVAAGPDLAGGPALDVRQWPDDQIWHDGLTAYDVAHKFAEALEAGTQTTNWIKA